MATATSRAVEYKGRNYRLLFLGQTKYGIRAHLQFFDGTKDFWCDGNLVSERASSGSHDPDSVRCQHCGKRTPGGDDWCMVCGRADYER